MMKRTDLYASLRPHAEEMQVNLGEVLFYEGDRGDCFYYVVSGQLRVLTRDSNNEMQTLGYLFPGDHCGEGALLTGKPRRATVRAVEPSTVLKISQGGFRALVSEHRELTSYLLDQVQDIAYRNFTRFIELDTINLSEAMQLFFQCLERKVIAAKEKAVWRDEKAKSLYLIGRGTLQLRETDQPDKRLKPGDFFGGIQCDEITIETETEVVLYILSHIDFARVLEKASQLIRVFEKNAQDEQEDPLEIVPQNGRIKTIEIEPENSISDQSPRKLRNYITFPYIKQHDETDCGAACLGMICQYYGQSIGLNRLRDMANVSREGTSLSALAEAAENLGFLTRGVRIGYSEIGERDLPLIAHWEGYHFVVLYRINSKYAWIADPALGRRKISRKEFEDKWSKLALILEYTDKVSNYRGRKSSFRRFFPLARPYLGILIEIMMASLLLNLFGLASPLFTQMILDQVLVHQDNSLLNLMLFGMIIIALFRIATSSLRNYLIGYVGARISISMLSHIYHHLLRLPMRFFALRRTGEIMTRFRESQYLRSLLTETAISAVLDAIMIFVYLGLMFYYHTTLTLWVLAFIPLSIILTLIYTPILKSINQRSFLARSEWSSSLIDSLRGIEVIKTLAVEKSTRWSWEERLTQEIKIGFTAIKTNMLFGSFGQLNNVLGSTIVLWYGANLVIQGDLSVGQLIAFNMLSGRVLGPIMGLINLWPQIQLAKLGLDRLNDIYDMRTESSRNRNYSVQLTDVEGHVKFDNVFFRYGSGSTEPYVLSDINLDISPGQKVAIVGRSGAGKTTLVKLIPRLFDPTEGCVTLDDTDLREFDPGWLRRQVGMVLQEPVMFNATITENIAIGVKYVDMDRLMQVSKLAYAHDFIKDLPMGYETKIREQGVGLSGGQRQRLSIARALYGDPKIIIFDEATNALDTESERAIQEGLDTMLEGKTAFIIAHRVSTVKDADLILVLDDGNIIEQGTHDTLIAEKGLYYNLSGQQLQVV
ncbi:MAG: peptidase domain-containing ABC transporter [Candidatus Latescibacteria bacterium]|nr:peptidase domain-containing ABC transporter [Candidatus Latescibacterota bacterium]